MELKPTRRREPDAATSGQPRLQRVRRSLVTVPGAERGSALPDPGGWAAKLAVGILQVFVGSRSLTQLERWLSDDALTSLSRYAARRRRESDDAVDTAQLGVVSIRTQCPAPLVAEVAAHVRHGPRSVAMALRLEVYGDRWLCTVLDLGPT